VELLEQLEQLGRQGSVLLRPVLLVLEELVSVPVALVALLVLALVALLVQE